MAREKVYGFKENKSLEEIKTTILIDMGNATKNSNGVIYFEDVDREKIDISKVAVLKAIALRENSANYPVEITQCNCTVGVMGDQKGTQYINIDGELLKREIEYNIKLACVECEVLS